MTKIKTLIDNETGERFIPQTHVKAVFDDNGNTLDTLIHEPDKDDFSILDNKLKLADRNNLDTKGGMGYVILRKNGKTFKKQVEGKSNTIFEIRYDFDLEGDTVNLEKDCILKFEGGSVRNGTLNGNNTVIDAKPVKIFGDDLILEGSWNNKFIPQWFGAKGDGKTDCTSAFQKLNGKSISILPGTYLISNLILGENTSLLGSGKGNTILKQKDNSTGDFISLKNWSNGTLVNLSIIGGNNIREINLHQALLKIKVTESGTRTNNSEIYNIIVKTTKFCGISILGNGQNDNGDTCLYNWIFGLHDVFVKDCEQYCLYNKSSDNRFHDLSLSNGGWGCLFEEGSSNVWNNLKLDGESGWNKPKDVTVENWIDTVDKGANLILKASTVFLSNIDIQSAAYCGAKLFDIKNSNINITTNNCGTYLTQNKSKAIGVYIFSMFNNIFNYIGDTNSNELVHIKTKDINLIENNILNISCNFYNNIGTFKKFGLETILKLKQKNTVNCPNFNLNSHSSKKLTNLLPEGDLNDPRKYAARKLNTNFEFLTKNSADMSKTTKTGSIEFYRKIPIKKNHLYVILCCSYFVSGEIKYLGQNSYPYFNIISSEPNVVISTVNSQITSKDYYRPIAGEKNIIAGLFTCDKDTLAKIRMYNISETIKVYVTNFCIYDLTQELNILGKGLSNESSVDIKLDYNSEVNYILSMLFLNNDLDKCEKQFSDLNIDYLFDNYNNNWGSIENKPLDPKIGDLYFDTDLGIYIWWNGTKWIDSKGNTVDENYTTSDWEVIE